MRDQAWSLLFAFWDDMLVFCSRVLWCIVKKWSLIPQISLHGHSVWSGSSLFTYRINWNAPCKNVSSSMCGQQRPRSDCASAQSDQGLHCPLTESLDTTECMNREQRFALYSQNLMARTSLGPWKFVRGKDSLSHWGLIMGPGQEANGDHLGKPLLSSIQYWYVECTH